MEKDTSVAVDPAIKDNPDDAGVHGFDKDGNEVEPITTGELENIKDQEEDIDSKDDDPEDMDEK